MLGLIVGILAIVLGAKAFTPKGIPLTRKKNLTGVTAKVIGVFCVLLGVVFLLDGILAVVQIGRLLGG